ncbi:Hypothetical predicted protein [Mytilus galloprovincialis]|uniref:Uncharacterized protein n=1 Tax=Mytilus galloprovincialis TaxID=29158 RepID=A0A8B6DKT0_MYTGA|nr:Hypothetical predicted protein [Mytilus galloprovincialis]
MTDSEYVSQVEIFFKDQQLRAEKPKSVNARVTNKPAGNLLIDHDFSFRLLSAAIDMYLYNRVYVHLNMKGVAKLTKNLDITRKEKPNK